ncbi:MAG: 4'-phosphopantetheinyl transferase superfamily protein [Kiritimatiellia bacterium]
MSADFSESFGSELVLLGADSVAQLAQDAKGLIAFLDQVSSVELRDVAYTCARKFGPGQAAVLAIVASDTAELRGRLASAAARLADERTERIRDRSGTYFFRRHVLGEGGTGKLAFVYSGAMSFYPDMLREVAVRFRECRLPFDELESALKGKGPFQPSSFIFPPAPHYRQDADVFTAGGYAEALVSTYSANLALTRMFQALGIVPDAATGFSGGDLSALAVGGLLGKFERKDRLKFLQEVYKVVNTAVSHAGLPKCLFVSLVSPHPEQAAAALADLPADQASVAYRFSPRHLTVAFDPEHAEGILHRLAGLGIRSHRLSVDRPFNTPWCRSVLPLFRKFASNWVDEKPRIPVYSCGTAERLPMKVRKVRDGVAEQWVEPVRFEETIRRMHADGVRVFLEVGPRGTCSGFVDEVLHGEEHVALAADSIHRAGLLQLMHVVGMLAALGAPVDPSLLFRQRRCRLLPFDAPLALSIRNETELRLSREFPRLLLLTEKPSLEGSAMVATMESAPDRRDRAAARRRAAAVRLRQRQQQFGYGAAYPLISDMNVESYQPSMSIEISKVFSFDSEPLLADFAMGTSQLSHPEHGDGSAPPLRGFTVLTLVMGAEIMAELAQTLTPGLHVVAIDDLQRRRTVPFQNGRLKLFVRAEHVASSDPKRTAVRVQIREDAPDSVWTWPAMEGTFLLTKADVAPVAFTPPPHEKARDVHWAQCDIYPDRLFAGRQLQGIAKADRWSEEGLDYEVVVPASDEAVRHTTVPCWVLNPQLLAAVTDGFQLWRSHERFAGAVSYAFRLRVLTLHKLAIPDNAHLQCYLRNTGVTPTSLVADIFVSDGNGNLLMELHGYEELTVRVPDEYRRLLLEPARTYLSRDLPDDRLGSPGTSIASAMLTDVDYPLFERNEELWLKALSHIVLGRNERREFSEMAAKGGVARRTEWLFGRIAAKEAVRRFLERFYQARWSDADVQVYTDPCGKPLTEGPWQGHLWQNMRLDVSIAHTSRFVLAVAAMNARVGVDVEASDRCLSDEFTHGVFLPEEQELAVNAVDSPSAIIRFWCAKEAVSKALGTGIRYSPRELVVVSFKAETGALEIELRGQWLQNFKMFTGRTVPVATVVVKGHVVASCFIPDRLFG